MHTILIWILSVYSRFFSSEMLDSNENQVAAQYIYQTTRARVNSICPKKLKGIVEPDPYRWSVHCATLLKLHCCLRPPIWELWGVLLSCERRKRMARQIREHCPQLLWGCVKLHHNQPNVDFVSRVLRKLQIYKYTNIQHKNCKIVPVLSCITITNVDFALHSWTPLENAPLITCMHFWQNRKQMKMVEQVSFICKFLLM